MTPALFWEKVDRRIDPDECWPWMGTRRGSGYGFAKVVGCSSRAAHRVAWTLVNGPVPADIFVCHRCDNPPCCNPGHLFLGTIADNSLDMVQKGRSARGERNRNAKLTAAQVVEIRAQHSTGEVTLVEIATQYGLSRPCVGAVVRGKTWRHILPAVGVVPANGCEECGTQIADNSRMCDECSANVEVAG